MNCFENDIFRPVSLNNSYDILLFTCIVIATTVQVICTFATFLLTSSSLVILFHLIKSIKYFGVIYCIA